MAGLSQRIEARQSQNLVMTPQLQLSLKILQLSNQELSEYLEQEFEKNPLLSIGDSESAEATHESEGNSAEENSANGQSVESGSESAQNESNSDYGSDISPTSANESEQLHIKEGGGDFSGDSNYFEQILSEEIPLREHLLDQINLDFEDGPNKLIALHLLDMLDESGYIQIDIHAVAQQLGCNDSAIEEVLSDLQRLDPPGIFARSLSECLALQLKDRDRLDPAMEKLLANLDQMAKGNLDKLQKICGVSKEDLLDMCREIKTLDPKPGTNFASEKTQVIQPDIYLRKGNNGAWVIELNNETLPKLIVNRKYYTEVRKKTREDNEKKYITEQFNTANWLARAVHQRAETIMKVSSEIVSQQHDFFEKGIFYLKPLILRNIAEKIEMHESTVARVTSNKYMMTPRGMFELKYFFSSGVQGSSGDDDVSSKTVKHLISELISKESNTEILSDDTIADILKGKGIDVARRTVAKYRESMNIPSSFNRRQKKKLNG